MAYKSVLFASILIFTFTFSMRASNNMIITTVPLIARYYFHFSDLEIGVVSSLVTLISFFSSAFINARLPSVLRRKVFIASSIIYAVLFPFFYFSNPILLWFLASLVGFTLGIVGPNIMTSAGLFEDGKVRERMLSLYTVALSTSLIVGPFIESIVLTRFTLFQAFLFFTSFALILAFLSPLIEFPSSQQSVNRKGVVRNKGFLIPIFLNLMYALPFGLLTTFGGIYAVSDFHASYSLATALFGMFFLTSLLGRLFVTVKAPDRLLPYIIIASTTTVFGLLLVAIAPNIYAYAFGLLVLGVPHGLTYPISLIAMTRSFPSEEVRSVANSYFSAIMMGFAAFVPMTISILVEAVGIRLSFLSVVPVSLAFFGGVIYGQRY
ncbi:MFS transporter, partial [Acidianus sp. RZ1]